MNKKNNKSLFIIIWVLLLFVIVGVYIYINYININKNELSPNFQWTWSVEENPITFDNYIQDIDDTNIDKALELAIKRYNDNNQSDLWDYEQLMYIYLDKAEYDEVISLWNKALEMIKQTLITEVWIRKTILSQLAQWYLYKWDIINSKKIILSNELLSNSLERYMYEYKVWKYNYIINNLSEISKFPYHDHWVLFILLSKSYDKIWENDKVLETYKALYNLWKSLEWKDSLFEAYYSYISTDLLIKNFKDILSPEEYNLYIEENNKYKQKIDSQSKIEFTDSQTDIFYNKDLMYFNINRIINF